MSFYPTASATAYGQTPKFVKAKHSAKAEGENWAYGPTLEIRWKSINLRARALNEPEIVLGFSERKTFGFSFKFDLSGSQEK